MPRVSGDVYAPPQVCTGTNIFTVENSFDPGADTSFCWPSPNNGQQVTVCGIITAVRQATYPSFYLQDQGNTAWGGIYCYDYTLPDGSPIAAHLGDYVQISASINEYWGWTELDTVTAYTILGTGQSLPDTSVVTVSAFTSLCDYGNEPYESELIRINNVTVRSAQTGGKYWITDASTADSIRIDDDLWVGGTNLPNPLPSTGAVYDYIIGVIRWEGRNGGANTRGWILMPRFGSDYHQLVIPEPNVVDVWSINSTTLAATFDRAMDPVTTGNASNYSTHGGLGISAAALDPTNNRKVLLTTANQPNNVVDTLIVTGVCDSTMHCMTTAHRKLYHSGITSISLVNYPFGNADTTGMYNQGVITADTSMTYPNNLFMEDASGPPYNGVLLYIPAFANMPHFGDSITVSAWASEYFGQTEMTGITTLNNLNISHAGPTPAPVPYHVTAHDLFTNGEQYEGILVTVCDSFVVTNLSPDTSALQYGFTIRSLSSPNDSIIVHKQATHTRYTYAPTVGNIIRGITGVYRYQRANFRIMPRYDADFNSFATWCGGPSNCVYRPGDINGNGATNGIDVTYGVGFFKGGPVPPNNCGNPVGPCPQASPFYAAGDVNGSCVFNGIDITFFVGFLKGQQPALLNCPTCPPATLAAPAPEIPTLIPILKAKALENNAR
jgi:hypothetical protein